MMKRHDDVGEKDIEEIESSSASSICDSLSDSLSFSQMRDLVSAANTKKQQQQRILEDCSLKDIDRMRLSECFCRLHCGAFLDLSGHSIGPRGMQRLVGGCMMKQQLCTITWLNLGENNLGDEGVRILLEVLLQSEDCCNQLWGLVLRDNHLTNTCIQEYLLPFLPKSSLKYLDLSYNEKLDCTSAMALANAFQSSCAIEELLLYGTSISDRGAMSLRDIAQNNSSTMTLKRLGLPVAHVSPELRGQSISLAVPELHAIWSLMNEKRKMYTPQSPCFHRWTATNPHIHDNITCYLDTEISPSTIDCYAEHQLEDSNKEVLLDGWKDRQTSRNDDGSIFSATTDVSSYAFQQVPVFDEARKTLPTDHDRPCEVLILFRPLQSLLGRLVNRSLWFKEGE